MRFLALFFFTIQCAYAVMSPLAKEMLVPDLTGMSFPEVRSTLEAHEAAFAAKVNPAARAPVRTGYPRYSLQDKKTPFVFVIIHGLFRNPAQFRQLKGMLDSTGQNVMYVNLPGHGMDMFQANRVSYHDWVKTARRATSAALALGDKIIFLTQSTGGALALRHTLAHPETVAGLFLIEPAIRVNKLVSSLVCVVHPVMPSLNWLYGMAGRDDDLEQLPYMGTRMGCEVDKLMDRYLKDHSGFSSRRKQEAELFAQIKVPVITFNNMADKIVSTKANRRFMRSVQGPAFYVEIPREGASYHADSDFMYGVIQHQRAQVDAFFQAMGLPAPAVI